MGLRSVCIQQGTVLGPWSDTLKFGSIMSNPDIWNWLKWVNENICHRIFYDDLYTTTMVKVRIATGMLNNIESLTDSEKIEIHMNFTRNVQEAYGEYATMNLPF